MNVKQNTKICAVAAIIKGNRAIGKNGDLIWRNKEDMARFKDLTTGHPVIMGDRTWLSLPEKFRPLSNRTNIVVTLDKNFKAEGAVVVYDIESAIEYASTSPGNDLAFVMGGGQTYKFFLPHVDRLYLTVVDLDTTGDTFFPEYEKDFKLISEENHDGFSFQVLERIKN